MSFLWLGIWIGVLGGMSAGVLRYFRARRPFLLVHPRYRSFFRERRLVQVDDFLALSGVILTGHPDRNVTRITLGSGPAALGVILKREQRISWLRRLSSWLVGLGWSSRSLQEARALQAAEREAVPAPQWLAVGEDSRGRAFLLLREEVEVMDLPAFLQANQHPDLRKRLALRLGQGLARLHAAGFQHADLYANHVLVRPDGSVVFLDWQRALRGCARKARVLDLACLHATLAREVVGCRERLLCLRAYRKHLPASALSTDQAWSLRELTRAIRQRARRLLGRRHVREKRNTSSIATVQSLIPVNGDSLCLTAVGQESLQGTVPGWLAFEVLPLPAHQDCTRRWLTLPDGRTGLLVRSREEPSWQARWGLRRSGVVAQQRQVVLLLRLQRQGLPVPEVLALGRQRQRSGAIDSLMLMAPPGGTIALGAWLGQQCLHAHKSGSWKQIRHVLHQAGVLLRRLHRAGCYLDASLLEVLSVQVSEETFPHVVLDGIDQVRSRRRLLRGQARCDLHTAYWDLVARQTTPRERRWLLSGYRGTTAARAKREGRPCRGATSPHSPWRSSLRSLFGVPRALWHCLRHGVVRLWQREDWHNFAGRDWAEDIMEVQATECCQAKQGRSTWRWALPARAGVGGSPGELTVYLKRQTHFSWWRWLRACAGLRGGWSPAVREWHNLHWAREQGFSVPEPVAAAEFQGPGPRLQSCLAVAELTGMLSLDQALTRAVATMDAVTFRVWKAGLIEEAARQIRRLHDRRHFHKDLYLCHFYVHQADLETLPLAGWKGRLFVIDLHRLAHHPWTWPWWQMKDLAQLLYSAERAGMTARDRLRFWWAYRGGGPGRFLECCFLWGVGLRARCYHRHNARQAQHPEFSFNQP